MDSAPRIQAAVFALSTRLPYSSRTPRQCSDANPYPLPAEQSLKGGHKQCSQHAERRKSNSSNSHDFPIMNAKSLIRLIRPYSGSYVRSSAISGYLHFAASPCRKGHSDVTRRTTAQGAEWRYLLEPATLSALVTTLCKGLGSFDFSIQ
jgi:hypothetical protein